MSRYSMRKTSQGFDMYDSDDQSYLNTDDCVERMNEQAAEIERLKVMMGDVVDQILNHQITGDEECPFCMGELVSRDVIKEFKAMVRK